MEASALRPLRLIVFPGPFNWPLWVGQELGLFAQNNVAVELTATPGSVFQWEQMGNGRADLAITLMDNVIAYHEGQGETPLVVDDAVALMAVDARVLPSLVTLPTITHYAALKGQTLSVDAMSTGLVLVLLAMLEKGGLQPGDYRLEKAGGVLQRFDALKRGEHAGALFNSPFEGMLRDAGYCVLGTAAEAMPRYQGHVVAARTGWAAANRSAVEGFLRGLSAAIAWLYVPANREAAFALFRRNLPDASAEAAYAILFHPESGFSGAGTIDDDDVAAMLDLRARYGRPSRVLGAPSRYVDRSYLPR